jgi:hypothetical protein
MKTRKVVINIMHGGFGLSHRGVMTYAKLKGIKLYPWINKSTKEIYGKNAKFSNPDINVYYSLIPIKNADEYEKLSKGNDISWDDYNLRRDDPILIKTIKLLGNKADSKYSKLKIVKIPIDIEWNIEEYDGSEWVSEKHRTWS